jgi:hypothetical protein
LHALRLLHQLTNLTFHVYCSTGLMD